MTKLALAFVTTAALLGGGCKKKLDMAKYKARATALAAKYAPLIAEHSKHLPDIAKHAKDLPVNVPGAEKLGKLIADNESTIKSAQDVLAGLPGKIGKDSPEQAEKDLAEAEKLLDEDMKHIEQDEKDEAATEAEIVAATTIGGAGSAAPAVSPAGAGSAAPTAGSAAPAAAGSAQ